MNRVKALICMVRGHFYRPTYKWFFIGSVKRPRKQGFQYACERCGGKTQIMTVAQHLAFEVEHCPTWGGPGSDSQGYRVPKP